MPEFTFNDFVDCLGQSNSSDPCDVVEAWEEFQQLREEGFSIEAIEANDYA